MINCKTLNRKTLNCKTLLGNLILGILFSGLFSGIAYAQVGIGTTTPHSSAALDITAQGRGILIPRITSTERMAIASPATGLMVYDKETKTFQYYDGTAWIEIKVGEGAVGPTGPQGPQGEKGEKGDVGPQGPPGTGGGTGGTTNGWSYTGNSGLDGSNNFLGTLDAVPLHLRTNNANRLSILSTTDDRARIGINIDNPEASLHIRHNQVTSTTAEPILKIEREPKNALQNRDVLTVTSNGNMGIGTTNPLNQLHIFDQNRSQIRLETAGTNSFFTMGISNTGMEFINNALNKNIEFRTFGGGFAASRKMSIEANGEVIIGSSTSSATNTLLSVYGPAQIGPSSGSPVTNTLLAVNGSTQIGSSSGSPVTNTLLAVNGSTQIGSSSSPVTTTLLTVYGEAEKSGGGMWSTASDGRFKTNITNLDSSLDKIMRLRPVTWNWNTNFTSSTKMLNKTNYGFIAQEVQSVFPQMVNIVEKKVKDRTVHDFHMLDLSDIIPYFVKAFQEQQGIIENQTAKIENLEVKIARIEALLNNKFPTQYNGGASSLTDDNESTEESSNE